MQNTLCNISIVVDTPNEGNNADMKETNLERVLY
jgi:hypothetical protein